MRLRYQDYTIYVVIDLALIVAYMLAPFVKPLAIFAIIGGLLVTAYWAIDNGLYDVGITWGVKQIEIQNTSNFSVI